MPASNKVGTQLLVSPHLRDRARALAIVRHESVAEVWRAALEGPGLPGLEQQHADGLETLNTALRSMKMEKEWALSDMIKRRLWLSDLYPNGKMAYRYPREKNTRPTDAADEAA